MIFEVRPLWLLPLLAGQAQGENKGPPVSLHWGKAC